VSSTSRVVVVEAYFRFLTLSQIAPAAETLLSSHYFLTFLSDLYIFIINTDLYSNKFLENKLDFLDTFWFKQKENTQKRKSSQHFDFLSRDLMKKRRQV